MGIFASSFTLSTAPQSSFLGGRRVISAQDLAQAAPLARIWWRPQQSRCRRTLRLSWAVVGELLPRAGPRDLQTSHQALLTQPGLQQEFPAGAGAPWLKFQIECEPQGGAGVKGQVGGALPPGFPARASAEALGAKVKGGSLRWSQVLLPRVGLGMGGIPASDFRTMGPRATWVRLRATAVDWRSGQARQPRAALVAFH